MNLDKKSRIRGALIGAAYGDAFGMPSETWTPEKIKEKFGYIDDFLPGDEDNEISRGFRPGEVTDDTINMIFVIEMLAETDGEVRPEIFIQKLRKWAGEQEKSKSVIGPSTAAAFAKLDQGVPMEITGRNGVTNGGAMKILPVGLLYGDKDMEVLAEQVQKLCMPTHNTSCTISAACAVAAAAGKALQGEESLEKILAYGAEGAKAGESRGYKVCSPSVARRIRLAAKIAGQEKEAAEILKDLYEIIGTGLASAESIPAALGILALGRGNPVLCARYGANIGGDTDTIGAMACGICGTYMGDGIFDEQEIRLLEKVNGINFDQLTDMLLSLKSC